MTEAAGKRVLVNAIRTREVVGPGGVIEVRAPELPAGATVEVIVIVDASAAQLVSLVGLIGAARGGLATPEEADAFIRQERDAWES